MKTLAQKMKTMTGYCSACGDDILDLTKKWPDDKRLPNYREHFIGLSNGTLMRVGVCDRCKAKLTSGTKVQEIADRILSNHKTHWDTLDRPPKGHRDFSVDDPNADDLKFRKRQSLNRHNKLRQ